MQDPKGPSRPLVDQKARYVPHSEPEEFIVPLLRREIEACIASYATPPRGTASAVDVGCGAQPFRALLEQIGYSYCGIDVNSNHASVDVVWAVDEPLPEELRRRAPFDFLLCTEVLEHVADWHAAFANFGSLLAPGGRALITAPHFFQLHEEPYDFWRPTPHAIDYYADRAGLERLYRRAAGDAWDVLGTALANCQFVASSTRLADRALAKAIRFVGRFVFRTLARRNLQRHVTVRGPLYLSNVVVLEKQAAAE
jgi:SAM-dependent methyltransferase